MKSCVSNRDILLVNGDMNCKVGGLHIKEPNFVGKHSNIERSYNDRDKTFVNFCKENNLSSSSTAENIRGYLMGNKLRISLISYAYVNRL